MTLPDAARNVVACLPPHPRNEYAYVPCALLEALKSAVERDPDMTRAVRDVLGGSRLMNENGCYSVSPSLMDALQSAVEREQQPVVAGEAFKVGDRVRYVNRDTARHGVGTIYRYQPNSDTYLVDDDGIVVLLPDEIAPVELPAPAVEPGDKCPTCKSSDKSARREMYWFANEPRPVPVEEKRPLSFPCADPFHAARPGEGA